MRPRKTTTKQDAAAPAALPLLRPILRELTDRNVARIRADFPGWDLHALKAEFDRWLDSDTAREPSNYDAAFYGFMKQHHDRNRHQLRG